MFSGSIAAHHSTFLADDLGAELGRDHHAQQVCRERHGESGWEWRRESVWRSEFTTEVCHKVNWQSILKAISTSLWSNTNKYRRRSEVKQSAFIQVYFSVQSVGT